MQGRAGQGWAGLGRAGQGRAGQGRAGQGSRWFVRGLVRGEIHLQWHVGGGVTVVARRAPATSRRSVRFGLFYDGVARRAPDELPRRVRHQRALVRVRDRVQLG